MLNKVPKNLHVYRLYCDSGALLRVLAEQTTVSNVWDYIHESKPQRKNSKKAPGVIFWNTAEGGTFTEIILDPFKILGVRAEADTAKAIQPHIKQQRSDANARMKASQPVSQRGKITLGKSVVPIVAKKGKSNA